MAHEKIEVVDMRPLLANIANAGTAMAVALENVMQTLPPAVVTKELRASCVALKLASKAIAAVVGSIGQGGVS